MKPTVGRFLSVRAVLVYAVLLSLIGAPVAGQRSDPLRGLDAFIEKERQNWGVVGVSVAIVKDDAVVYAKGFGVREAGRPEPVDAHTLFAIGSNTKAFTAAAVGLLVEEGKMRWDDPVTKHLPEFQLFDPYVTREMTMRDALSHRSGLSRGDMIWYAAPFERAEVIRRVRHLEPSWSFRSNYGYQNIMYIAAGEALARASGESWDDFIRRRFLGPLGMARSNTSVKALDVVDNVATPHTKVEGEAVPIAWRDIDNAGPAGSINSSVSEMTAWVRMLLAGGTIAGRRVLSDTTIRELQTPHTITGSGMDTIFPMRHFSTYGLGFGLSDYYGRKLVQHSGGIDGMLSYVALVPEERLGLIVLTNTSPQNLGAALLYHIIDGFIDAPQRDWSDVFQRLSGIAEQRADSAERALVTARVAGTRPSLALEQFAGKYQNEMYGSADVALEGDALVLSRHDSFTGRLEHWHYDTFRATWAQPGQGKSMVRFELDPAGRAAILEVVGLGRFRRAAQAPVE